MEENWKTIPMYPKYMASDLGNIRNGLTDKPIKQYVRLGYCLFQLSHNGKSKAMFVHRAVISAFLGDSPLVVDHIDNNKRNNKLENLRYCTQRDNITKYTETLTGRSSELTGVCWNKKAKRWMSSIKVNSKHKTLGYFESELEAHEVYIKYKNSLPIAK